MTASEYQAAITTAANLIQGSHHIVVFTGAGVSTESGIPDFRSPGGIWDIFNPEDFTFDAYLRSPEARRKNWLLVAGDDNLLTAQPNAAHQAIAEMDRLGKLDCVITQNIDDLHQKAGTPSEKTIELHGTLKWVRCLDCGRRWPVEEIIARLRAGEEDPHCEHCGGIIKSTIVSFGEMMPVEETLDAERRSSRCDLFIVVGSSLVVYPAASMPWHALDNGARLIIINRDPTPLDRYADVVIHASAGEVMQDILAKVRAIATSFSSPNQD